MDDFPQFDSLHVRAPEFEVLPRPRLAGDDRRRPDAARTSFQSAVARSFINKPKEPCSASVVTVHVPCSETLPAAATLKASIDATVSAGVLRNDRSAILAAKLVKYKRMGLALATTDVEVVPHEENDPWYGSFMRTATQASRMLIGSCVVDPVAYADRSGIPGAASFQNPWVSDPTEYESQLRDRWRNLVDAGRVIVEPEDWADLLLSASLTVHLPKACTEDGDNALLYIVDMLEIVRRDALGYDAGARTLDQLLVEVSFQRSLERGVWIWLSPQDADYPAFTVEGGWHGPFDPELL
jgi:hypothetical protein